MRNPAIFLDRDGVLIENLPGHVRRWSDVRLLPGTLDALRALNQESLRVVVVTNQSAVGLGLVSAPEAEAINTRLLQQIQAAGGRIDAVYLCPHRPEDGCDCRKPRPGMLLRAARDLDIDLERSILVGDALTDLQAAWAAGVPTAVLVRTGRGAAQEQLGAGAGLPPFRVVPSLLAFSESVLLPETQPG